MSKLLDGNPFRLNVAAILPDAEYTSRHFKSRAPTHFWQNWESEPQWAGAKNHCSSRTLALTSGWGLAAHVSPMAARRNPRHWWNETQAAMTQSLNALDTTATLWTEAMAANPDTEHQRIKWILNILKPHAYCIIKKAYKRAFTVNIQNWNPCGGFWDSILQRSETPMWLKNIVLNPTWKIN